MDESLDPNEEDYPPGPRDEWLVSGDLEERMLADATIATAPDKLAFIPAYLAEFWSLPAAGAVPLLHHRIWLECGTLAAFPQRVERRTIRLLDRTMREVITGKLHLKKVILEPGRHGSQDVFAALALARATGAPHVAIVDTTSGDCRDLSTTETRKAAGFKIGSSEATAFATSSFRAWACSCISFVFWSERACMCSCPRFVFFSERVCVCSSPSFVFWSERAPRQ